MARLLGIDATKTTVRAAIIRTSYRRVSLEAFGEADIGWAGSEAEAIRAAVGGARPDACAIALSGERSFFRRVELPAAAQKEINNVLAFELEATVPFEMDDAIFDHRVLKPAPGAETIPVFAALARVEDVRGRITPVREAIGIEPERVGAGPLPLANLVAVMPEMEQPAVSGPVAILDIGEQSTEVVILVGGDPVFARTLSRGTVGLPASSVALVRELRQTFAAWRTQGGDPLACMYLSGVGAAAENATGFLAEQLGVNVLPLPEPRIEGLLPEQAAQLPRYAKALSLALGLAGRSKGLNLRRGPLEAERSYPFLREKIPLLSGLAAVILVSFGFSTVAELRAIDAEHETLTTRLAVATRDVLGEEITEPDKVKEAIDPGPAKADEDPLPHVDAFDVMVQLSKAVPKETVHDVVDFDVQRGKVVIQGVVATVGDAETIAKNLQENRCFKDVKKGRTSQYTEGKTKYQIEFELKCEAVKKKPATPDADGSAQPAASAKPDKDKTEGGK
jgi:general secretion pathway protein L